MTNLATLADCTDRCRTWSPAIDDPDGEFTYIDLSSVDKDTKRIERPASLACSDAPSRARQIVKAGDVLVSNVRPNLNGVAIVPTELEGATASTGYTVLRPNPNKVDGSYLFHWVKHPTFVDEMVRLATGASYPAVSDKIVREAKIPLPHLSEQRRIAKILDKADALRIKRREAIAKFDQLMQSVFNEMFGDPVANPKGWRTAPLSCLFDIARGGSPRPIDDFITDSPDGINWIMIGDASEGSKYITSTRKRIKPEGARRSRVVKPGDFLLTNSMSFGRPYIMRTTGCIHDGWLVLSPKDDRLGPDYLYNVLSSKSIYAEFSRRAPGAIVKNLNIELVSGVEVTTPPIELQQEFAAKIKGIEDLKTRLLRMQQYSELLFASIQQNAFSGGL